MATVPIAHLRNINIPPTADIANIVAAEVMVTVQIPLTESIAMERGRDVAIVGQNHSGIVQVVHPASTSID